MNTNVVFYTPYNYYNIKNQSTIAKNVDNTPKVLRVKNFNNNNQQIIFNNNQNKQKIVTSSICNNQNIQQTPNKIKRNDLVLNLLNQQIVLGLEPSRKRYCTKKEQIQKDRKLKNNLIIDSDKNQDLKQSYNSYIPPKKRSLLSQTFIQSQKNQVSKTILKSNRCYSSLKTEASVRNRADSLNGDQIPKKISASRALQLYSQVFKRQDIDRIVIKKWVNNKPTNFSAKKVIFQERLIHDNSRIKKTKRLPLKEKKQRSYRKSQNNSLINQNFELIGWQVD